MASGIKDKVAIVGMGCTQFGEHWDKGPEDLIVDAFEEAVADAKIARSDIQAAWMGNALDDINVGNSALPLAHALRLKTIPVSRVENMCATGSEALRAAVYAVAAGAVDFALALGVEKLKDTGYGGLPLRTKGLANDLWLPYGSAPGSFAQLAGAYAAKHRLNGDDLKRAMAHVSWKSHQNATQNPRAHLRKAVDIETILKAPMIADPLGLYDCCGVSDGAAAAIVTTPDIARGLGIANPVTVKAVQLSASHGWEMQYGAWDGSYVLNTQRGGEARVCGSGRSQPRDRPLPDGSPRLLLHHGTRHDGGPWPVGGGPRPARHPRWPLRPRTARSLVSWTAGSNASAIPSARPGCAWPMKSIPSFWVGPGRGSSKRWIWASLTISAARRSTVSPPSRSSGD